MRFVVEPVEGEQYEGRQWGYRVVDERGVVLFHAHTGGTGACWNIDTEPDDPDFVAAHVCDLDDFIAALQTLRDSPAYAENVARWAWPPTSRPS